MTAYDKNGVRVLLTFAADCPAGRPDVLVMVASMLSTAPQPVRNIVLQAAVPRVRALSSLFLILSWKLWCGRVFKTLKDVYFDNFSDHEGEAAAPLRDGAGLF